MCQVRAEVLVDEQGHLRAAVRMSRPIQRPGYAGQGCPQVMVLIDLLHTFLQVAERPILKSVAFTVERQL